MYWQSILRRCVNCVSCYLKKKLHKSTEIVEILKGGVSWKYSTVPYKDEDCEIFEANKIINIKQIKLKHYCVLRCSAMENKT